MSELAERLSELVIEIAEAEIAPRFRKLAPEEIMGKPSEADPNDVVTAADRCAEAALTEPLRSLVPGSCVVGEESTAANPELIHRLQGNDSIWVVDPLDGTKNFVAGRGPFGSMVALVRGGEILLAAIYLVLEKDLYLAESGAGAYRNGTRLNCAPELALPMRGTLYTEFVTSQRTNSLNPAPEGCTLLPPPMCAAFEYARLARTETDFALYPRLYPWDHAPGALLLREMGGVCRLLDGEEYTPSRREGLLLTTASESRWQMAHERLLRTGTPSP